MPEAVSPRLDVRHLTRAFGGRAVVEDVTLAVAPGQVTCLLGPSGCGKSTTLRMIAGVERAEAGEIRIDGRLVAGPGVHVPPEARSVGLMFQDFALFPHLTVAENVGFGLRADRAEKLRRVGELLEKVDLSGFGPKHPHQLSGGEQQRVALARAFVVRPALLLADEPTGSLDHATGEAVMQLMLELNREAGTTLVLVTHDPGIAARCDRQIRIEAGRRVG